MILPYKNKLVSKSRELRKNATRHENRLWYEFLNNYPVKFRRQRPINGFIVDFYCESAGLVIELDGSQHYTDEGMEDDSKRTAVLEQYGLLILRFSNHDIDINFESVCMEIDKAVNERTTL